MAMQTIYRDNGGYFVWIHLLDVLVELLHESSVPTLNMEGENMSMQGGHGGNVVPSKTSASNSYPTPMQSTVFPRSLMKYLPYRVTISGIDDLT